MFGLEQGTPPLVHPTWIAYRIEVIATQPPLVHKLTKRFNLQLTIREEQVDRKSAKGGSL